MRTIAAIGTFIVGVLVISLLVVPGVRARNISAPALQATATTEATTEATTAATTEATTAATTAATTEATTAATTEATTAATSAPATTAATATAAPGALPRTGGDSDMSSLWLLGGALLLTCLAVAFLVSSRRNARL